MPARRKTGDALQRPRGQAKAGVGTPAADLEFATVTMHVAYLVNQYPKTSHTFIRREIQALEGLGVRVDRYALRGWDADVQDPADVQERERTQYVLRSGIAGLAASLLRALALTPGALLRAVLLALRMGRHSGRSLAYHLAYAAEACWLLRRLQDSGVHHLHAHFGTNAAEVAMLVHELGGIAYSFTVHGPEEFDMPVALGLQAKASRARFVVAVSSFGRSQLWRWLPLQHWHKVHVVHCGLGADFRDADVDPPPDIQRVVCVGRICEQKAQLLLLQAMRRYRDLYGQTFQLVLAGDGDMRRDVEACMAELGLQDDVRITGWIGSETVARELRAARALVLPSFAEGLPVVVMEAMALGRPVLTTYVAGIPELVRDGKEGWLVPAGSVESLTQALRACLTAGPEQLASIGLAARARVVARHDATAEAGKLADLMFPGRSPATQA